MKIIRNEKLIKRNAIIGQLTSLLSLAILGGGMYVSFKRPELFTVSVGALLIGFLMSQVGIYFGNRWGRSPRPDEILDEGLKGLPDTFTFYHYATPAANLLVGPAGVWVVEPYHQRGEIVYTGKRWKIKGGGFAQSYMRIFGQENVSRPDLDAGAEAERVKRLLKKRGVAEEQIPPILGVLVFTSELADVHADDAPVPTLHVKKLKGFMRKQIKESPLTPKEITLVNNALANEQASV
jgi:hypothetical protein